MMVRDETMDVTDAGRIYEIIKGDSYCDILDDEELKDNARQLHLRAIAESKKEAADPGRNKTKPTLH